MHQLRQSVTWTFLSGNRPAQVHGESVAHREFNRRGRGCISASLVGRSAKRFCISEYSKASAVGLSDRPCCEKSLVHALRSCPARTGRGRHRVSMVRAKASALHRPEKRTSRRSETP